ncbi:MAG: hypothetical protein OXC02_05905, partial [Rhodobacteraceae bacterium]|nr:hypothetical protein [Paracoccaceae bacterium]
KSCYFSNSPEIVALGVNCGKTTFNGEYGDGDYHYPIPRHNVKKIHPTLKVIGFISGIGFTTFQS